mmetsp:Transcript_67156/g.112440  ORF Transcript_67156/g.112440 Transcript_67156/m.112440 type:complete len:222 (-) Transcript_67156:1423-2088(-)
MLHPPLPWMVPPFVRVDACTDVNVDVELDSVMVEASSCAPPETDIAVPVPMVTVEDDMDQVDTDTVVEVRFMTEDEAMDNPPSNCIVPDVPLISEELETVTVREATMRLPLLTSISALLPVRVTTSSKDTCSDSTKNWPLTSVAIWNVDADEKETVDPSLALNTPEPAKVAAAVKLATPPEWISRAEDASKLKTAPAMVFRKLTVICKIVPLKSLVAPRFS